jgi:poly(A) polymerase
MDWDFTTDALPEVTKKILKKWADDIWDVGIKFGTIGAKKSDITFEVTTYRADSYESDSRKPEVNFGDNISGDLIRRDFTVNAMAIELTTDEPEFIDPHNGVTDLLRKVLRTPTKPEISFSDDPLRMLRAARFAAQLNFTIEDDVLQAMKDMADRLTINFDVSKPQGWNYNFG